MIRKAFVMAVNADKHDEYKARHDEIWLDLHEVLKTHGVHNYSIFLHEETHQLFGYAEIESQEKWLQIARTAACQRWWKFMSDIMPTNPDNSPISRDLSEVFHME